MTEYRFEGVNPEIVVVIPSFNLESGGKVPSGVCRKAELWVSTRLAEIEDGTDTQTQTYLATSVLSASADVDEAFGILRDSDEADEAEVERSRDDRRLLRRPGRTAVAVVLDLTYITPPGYVDVTYRGRTLRVRAHQVLPYEPYSIGTYDSKRLRGVSNPLTPDPNDTSLHPAGGERSPRRVINGPGHGSWVRDESGLPNSTKPLCQPLTGAAKT